MILGKLINWVWKISVGLVVLMLPNLYRFIVEYYFTHFIYIFSSGIMKVRPCDQWLFNKENMQMSDDKQLQDFGITMITAKAQSPAQLGLAIKYVKC